MARAVCSSAERRFPPDMPARLFRPQLGRPRFFVITGEATAGRSRSSQIFMEWWSMQLNDNKNVDRCSARAISAYAQFACLLSSQMGEYELN
jgi:hypothetical protein